MAKKTEGSVTVAFEGGKTRVYSAEVHGSNFAELAKEFVSKRPETRKIVKAAEVVEE